MFAEPARIGGTVHVPQRGWSTDNVGGRKTISESPQREDLLPPHVVRQMRRLDAVLLYGTLPPIHLRLVQWWKDKQLSALVPHGADGKPVAPPKEGTCPVDSTRRSEVKPVIDAAVMAEQVAKLPKIPTPPPPATPRPTASGKASPKVPADPPELDFSEQSDEEVPSDANRVAGKCERCGSWREIGEGRVVQYGRREVVICDPRRGAGI